VKGRAVNALHLAFTLVTENVFVGRVEVRDGIVPVQQFSVSARNQSSTGLAGMTLDLELGLLALPRFTDPMLVRMELVFTDKEGQPQVDTGAIQLSEVAARTLAPVELVSATTG
jgi:hypothetical protein